MKICSKCKSNKSLSEYGLNKHGKNGHHSICKECRRIQQIEYRKLTNADKKWRAKNMDKVRGYSKKNYNKNIEKHRQRNKERYKKNMRERPEKVREYQRNYYKTLNGRYAVYKKGAKKRGYLFNITIDEFKNTLEKSCKYCGGNKDIGIDRISNRIGYVRHNIAPCCKICNHMKRDMKKIDFISHCMKIYKFSLKNTPNEYNKKISKK